ncbi:MAG: sugar transporter [Anaerolineae bacterium]
MKSILAITALLLFWGCTNPPYRGKHVLGPDEFVMDSYKIREGKFAILQMEGKSFDGLSKDLLGEYKDVIHEGDCLQVALYHPTRQDLIASVKMVGDSVGFRVLEGKVVLPDLRAIEVQGLTLEEARARIQQCYDEEIKDVEVFLSYKDRKERKVELAGLVKCPTVPVDGKIRLFEILSLAAVPPNANFFKSYVARDNRLLPVDLYKLVKEGDMDQNIVMRGGDKVYIADSAASSLMVLGEVGQECVVDLPNGFMTLRQAIAEAKGIARTRDKRYIQLIRGSIVQPQIYTLNWRHVVQLPSDSLLLIPGDIVYVAATPITEWNRFVTDLLPTFIAIDLLTKGIKSVGVNID